MQFKNNKGSPSFPCGRHHGPIYRGIRQRGNGKWVSEIREPKKPNCIWLGTYPTPEMAAVAYDVAALALKGSTAVLNFPNSSPALPVPSSISPRDIQAAAAYAAAAAGAAADAMRGSNCITGGGGGKVENHDMVLENNTGVQAEVAAEQIGEGSGFWDEDLIFDMPNVLVSMAEGMLISPPEIYVPDETDFEDDYQNLWSH